MNRRSLITSLGAILAAPAIVRASSLMPVKAWVDEPVLLKATERYLVGRHGTISVRGNYPTGYRGGAEYTMLIGASERIRRGDFIVRENGYARPMLAEDLISDRVVILGVSETDTGPPL